MDISGIYAEGTAGEGHRIMGGAAYEQTARLVTIVDLRGEPGSSTADDLGEGPTGNAIPDRIVRFLIERSPASVPLGDIKAGVGGNPATVNRQAWTLASNAPDLQIRLRGWVVSPARGEYQLSPAAVARLQTDR